MHEHGATRSLDKAVNLDPDTTRIEIPGSGGGWGSGDGGGGGW